MLTVTKIGRYEVISELGRGGMGAEAGVRKPHCRRGYRLSRAGDCRCVGHENIGFA
jgi:hypothetical protein